MMRNSLFLLAGFLLLTYSFPFTTHAADPQSVLSCNAETLQALDDYQLDDEKFYKTCTGGSITTADGKRIPDDTSIKINYVYYENILDNNNAISTSITFPASELMGNGSYQYCSMTKDGQTDPNVLNDEGARIDLGSSPRVTNITFSASGYVTQSYTIASGDVCSTTNGVTTSPIGSIRLSPRSASENTYGCILNEDQTASSCVIKADYPGAEGEFTENACGGESVCGKVWYLIQGNDINRTKNCIDSEPGGDITVLEKFALEETCVTQQTGSGFKATPTPDPTPEPPLPPCRSPHVTTDGAFIGCETVGTGLGIGLNTDPAKFVRSIFTLLLSISGGIAILLIMRAGYKFMTSQGDPERVKEAREVLTSAVIGLLMIIFSLVILEIIGFDLLRIPGISR